MSAPEPIIVGALATLLGALVTGLAGVLGAWWQSRREHHRWLRDQRLAAYLAFESFMHRRLALEKQLREVEHSMKNAAVPDDVAALDETTSTLNDELARVDELRFNVTTPMMLLGPTTVERAARVFGRAALDEATAAENELLRLMRKTLRISS